MNKNKSLLNIHKILAVLSILCPIILSYVIHYLSSKQDGISLHFNGVVEVFFLVTFPVQITGIICIVDLMMRNLRINKKVLWILLILLGQIFGPAAYIYFVVVEEEKGNKSRGLKPGFFLALWFLISLIYFSLAAVKVL